jgi:hypothetical protein
VFLPDRAMVFQIEREDDDVTEGNVPSIPPGASRSSLRRS